MPPNSRFSTPSNSSAGSSSSSNSSSSNGSEHTSETSGSDAEYEQSASQLEEILSEARWKRHWVARRRLARVAYLPYFRPPIRNHNPDRVSYYNPFSRTPWLLFGGGGGRNVRRRPAPLVFIGPAARIGETLDEASEAPSSPASSTASGWARETEDALTFATGATYFQSEGGLDLE